MRIGSIIKADYKDNTMVVELDKGCSGVAIGSFVEIYNKNDDSFDNKRSLKVRKMVYDFIVEQLYMSPNDTLDLLENIDSILRLNKKNEDEKNNKAINLCNELINKYDSESIAIMLKEDFEKIIKVLENE